MTQIEIDGKSVRVWIDGHEVTYIAKLDVHAETSKIPVVILELGAGGKIK